MTLTTDTNITNFISNLLQIPTNSSISTLDNFENNISQLNQDDEYDFINSINGAMFIVDSHIYDYLVSYIENAIDYNNLSTISSLLLCKLIQSKLIYNYNNQPSFVKSNKELISTYLSLYTKTVNPSSCIDLLSTDVIYSSKLLDLVSNDPNKLISLTSTTFINKAYNYFNDHHFPKFENINANDDLGWIEFQKTVKSIQNNPKLVHPFWLSKKPVSTTMLKIFLSQITKDNTIINSIDNKLFLSNILLILITKAIAENKNKYQIHYLIYIYLYNFQAQAIGDSDGICLALSTVLYKNALSRFTGTPITNMKELREIYFNQFSEIVKNCPLIQLNELTNDDYIEYNDHKFLNNNPFYQMIFNEYDISMTKFRVIEDEYKAIQYFIKREQSYYRFLREQFIHNENELRPKYNEFSILVRASCIETPFRLNDNLFKQFYDEFFKLIRGYGKFQYDSGINVYNHYDNVDDYVPTEKLRSNGYLAVNNILTGFKYVNSTINTKQDETINNNHQPYKFETYNGKTSMHKILSQFVKINSPFYLTNDSNKNDSVIKYNNKYYVILRDNNTEILIDFGLIFAFRHFAAGYLSKSNEHRNITIKLCTDTIAKWLVENYIIQNNYRDNLACLIQESTDSGHAMCRIIENGETFIYDPNLIVNNAMEFSFNYINRKRLENATLFDNDIQTDLFENDMFYRQDYPKLVKFLGGNRDELVKLLLWLLIGVVVVVVVVLIIRYIQQSKSRCNCNGYSDK